MPTDDDWEDTGVRSIPTRPATNPGRERASARAALDKISELGDKLDDHAEADKEALDAINEKLETHGKSLSSLEASAAATNASLAAMTSELRHVRQLELVRVEGHAQTGLETARTQRVAITSRAKVWIALIGAFGVGIGAAVKSLVG